MPVPRTFHLGDADSPARRAVLRHGARRRPHLPQRAPARIRRGRRMGVARSARRSSTCWRISTRSTPAASGWPSSAARPDSWSASCAGGLSSGRRRRPSTCRRSTRCATISSPRCPSSSASAVVHGDYRLDNTILHPDRGRRDRRRARLGDEHARRSAGRPRGDARVLERGGRLRGPAPGADHGAGDRRARDSRRAPRSSSATPDGPASTSPTSTGISRSPTSSSRSCARESPPAPPAVRWSAAGFDQAERLVAPLVEAGRQQLSS